jgi:hypothetical protein
MRFPCRPVDAAFFETAVMRFKNVVELEAPPEDVFSILEDPGSWPRWFRGMRKVAWISGEPHGVGSTRTAWLTLVTIDEHFFRWEPGHRFSFYATGLSMPLAHALAEDYLLDQVGPGRSRFTYRVAIAPRALVRLGGPVARAYFASMFRHACSGLQRHVGMARTQQTGRRAG